MKLSDRYYPRVLIVGQSFDSFSGTGITLSNIFRGWPKDCLAAVAATEDFADTSTCQHYYRLGALEDYWVWPLSYMPREGKISGPVIQTPSSNVPSTSFSSAGQGSGKQGGRKSLFYAALDSLCAYDLLRRLRLSSSFMAWVRDFQPDILYSMLSNLGLIRFVADLVNAIQKPLVIQTLDDWPAWIYGHGLLSPYVRRRTDIELRALFRKATLRYAHSPGMREAFEGRYGLPFRPFYNLVDLQRWQAVSRTEWSARSPFRLLYAGRIGKANSTSLSDVCQCVYNLRQQGLDIVIDLLSPNHETQLAKDLARLEGVTVREPVPHHEIQTVIASADLLVLPLDFDPENLVFARYSMPSKMVDYMASGVPTLLYAPAEFAVARYLCDERCAFVVSEKSQDVLTESIRDLFADTSLRESLGRRAKAVVAENHDALKVREAFRQALVLAAQGEGGPIVKTTNGQK